MQCRLWWSKLKGGEKLRRSSETVEGPIYAGVILLFFILVKQEETSSRVKDAELCTKRLQVEFDTIICRLNSLECTS